MNTETKLIPISYFDPKSEVRLSVYADTLVLEPELTRKTLRAIRFGGYPEMVRAMSDAIYAGITLEAKFSDGTQYLQCSVKGYRRQITQDGVYATATLMANDDAQSADSLDDAHEDDQTKIVFTKAILVNGDIEPTAF